MRVIGKQTFRELSYDKTVEKLEAMLVYLDDWHDIDAADKEAVARLAQAIHAKVIETN